MKVLNAFLRKNVYTVGTHAYLLPMAMIDTRNDRTVLAVLMRANTYLQVLGSHVIYLQISRTLSCDGVWIYVNIV